MLLKFLLPILIGETSPIKLEEGISDFKQISTIDDPVFWLSIGIFICALSGIIFFDILRSKINNWEKKKISPVPLGNPMINSTWISFFIGLTITFSSSLYIFNFPIEKSMIFSIGISFLFGFGMWNAIKDLMTQVKNGTVKEIDEFF